MTNRCNWCGYPINIVDFRIQFCRLCGHEIGQTRITCRCTGCTLNRQILQGREEAVERLIKDLMK